MDIVALITLTPPNFQINARHAAVGSRQRVEAREQLRTVPEAHVVTRVFDDGKREVREDGLEQVPVVPADDFDKRPRRAGGRALEERAQGDPRTEKGPSPGRPNRASARIDTRCVGEGYFDFTVR